MIYSKILDFFFFFLVLNRTAAVFDPRQCVLDSAEQTEHGSRSEEASLRKRWERLEVQLCPIPT